MRITLAAALLTTIVGCSLFTSLSGFSAGADERDDDAGVAGDGNVSSTTDAGGGDASSEGGLPFCASSDAGFCDDFDDPTDTTFRKWITTTEPGGTVERAAQGFSTPNALASRVLKMGDAQIPARLEKTFESVNRLRMAYKFRFDEYDVNAVVTVGQVDLVTSAGNRSSVRLVIGDGVAKFEGAIYPAGAPGAFPYLTDNFPLADTAWHSVDMTCEWNQKPARVTVDFDGRRIVDGKTMETSTFGPGKLTVSAGIYYRERGDTPWRLLVDDVALWTE